jgi:hypothetical protein
VALACVVVEVVVALVEVVEVVRLDVVEVVERIAEVVNLAEDLVGVEETEVDVTLWVPKPW